MKVLIKSATIIDPESSHNGKTRDILLVSNKIEKIAPKINVDVPHTVKSPHLCISQGWVDIGTSVGEPGFEHRETLQSITKAARVGGYTTLVPFPNTDPVTQSKAAIKFLIDTGKKLGIKIFPIAAVSQDCKGEELSEMYDLHMAGAIAFSDGLKSVQHNGILHNALNYVKPFNGKIIHYPQDAFLSNGGQMHEGIYSTLMGMKGIPSVAESLITKRDLSISEYADASIIFYGVSSKESLKLIKQAKQKHQIITPYLNIIKNDSHVEGFNSLLKVTPPLRSKDDQNDLIKAVKEGSICAISSNHTPHDEEGKKLEFTFAKFGASGIETTFSGLNTYVGDRLDLNIIVERLSNGPRTLLSLPSFPIEEGLSSDITLFDPSISWLFEKTQSKSNNNPLLGQTLIGKVLATSTDGVFYPNAI
jgi:dihydroorotase